MDTGRIYRPENKQTLAKPETQLLTVGEGQRGSPWVAWREAGGKTMASSLLLSGTDVRTWKARETSQKRQKPPHPWISCGICEMLVAMIQESSWLLKCWASGASGLELEGREAQQLGSLSRDHLTHKIVKKGPDVRSLWRQLMSSMKVIAFKNKVNYHGQWTTAEESIWGN